jgi:hypothetical protein
MILYTRRPTLLCLAEASVDQHRHRLVAGLKKL